MKVEIFSEHRCSLGEGIYFDPYSRYLYWVDIPQSNVLRKNVDKWDSKTEVFNVGYQPSVILNVSNDIVTFVDKIGVKTLNVRDQSCNLKGRIPDSDLNIPYRANDGVVLSDGSALFGTMHETLNEEKGFLYRYKDGEVKRLSTQFHIPNTFIEKDQSILISDSFEKKIYAVSMDAEHSKKILWADFSDCNFTPDGGCKTPLGNIYVSLWDGSCILELNAHADVINRIELPVLRPTNCHLVDKRWLFITSAKNPSSIEDSVSGMVLRLDLGG
ncbi:SMP-30/gluconolactonase/LRE family protein [Aeromonas salmonicida]|uniref:SMP-30/gluconolactonase/LRE family protein n=1 Tax=Aeromonas salmonicida TaxID=645 RepID=UPI003D06C1CA